MAVGLSIELLTEILRCPSGDQGSLKLQQQQLQCQTCGEQFAISNGVAILLKDKK